MFWRRVQLEAWNDSRKESPVFHPVGFVSVLAAFMHENIDKATEIWDTYKNFIDPIQVERIHLRLDAGEDDFAFSLFQNVLAEAKTKHASASLSSEAMARKDG